MDMRGGKLWMETRCRDGEVEEGVVSGLGKLEGGKLWRKARAEKGWR